MEKVKKQFRLYDVYRFIATEKESKIQGITQYFASREIRLVNIVFTNGSNKYAWPVDEKELKQFIREVNKILHNCNKPGPKKKKS